jgi:hypothetical protein
LVAEVTDDKSLPQEERKRLQVETTPHKSRRAKLLKIADKTPTCAADDAARPKDGQRSGCSDYVDWAAEVVRSCRGLNAGLEGRL